MRSAKLLLIILICLFFLPFFLDPNFITNRNNDLLFFRPILTFFKDQILLNHHLPLWQNLYLSGAPFLGDPQNPLLYPYYYLSLFLPLNIFFLVFLLIHFFIAAIGMFYLGKQLKFSNLAALTMAVVYALSPKFIAHLEQGHLNMLVAFAYFPLFILSLCQIARKGNMKSSLILGLASAFMFLNYLTIFLYTIIFGIVFFIQQVKLKITPKQIKQLSLAIVIFLIITFPQIFVIIKYLPITTRNLITLEDVGPNVVSIRNHLKSIAIPYIYGLQNLSAETTLTFGIMPLILSIGGWFLVKRKNKLWLLIFFGVAFFFSLGTKTALYTKIITSLPILMSLRIPTRFWFITILGVALLSGLLINKISKFRKIGLVIFLLICLELFLFSQNYLRLKNNQVASNTDPLITQEILNEPGYFRIYCTQNCNLNINQFNKGLANGYNPIMLTNYYRFLPDAAGFKFGSYAMSMPPYQTYVDKPQPVAELMGVLGVKYLVSPYELTDVSFQKKDFRLGQFIYENLKLKPRVYLVSNNKYEEIKPLVDIPGLIQIPVNHKLGQLVISEIYTPFWQAITDKGQSININPEQNIILGLKIDQPIKTVTVRFLPNWINISIIISLLSSIALSLMLIFPIQTRKKRSI